MSESSKQIGLINNQNHSLNFEYFLVKMFHIQLPYGHEKIEDDVNNPVEKVSRQIGTALGLAIPKRIRFIAPDGHMLEVKKLFCYFLYDDLEQWHFCRAGNPRRGHCDIELPMIE